MLSEKSPPYLMVRIALGLALIMACIGLLLLAKSRSILTHLETHTLPGVDMAGEIKQGPSQLYVRMLEYRASDGVDAAGRERLRNDYDRVAGEFSALLSKYRNYRIGDRTDEGARRLDEVEAKCHEFDALARPFVGKSSDVSVGDLLKLEDAFREFDASGDSLFSFKWSRADQWVGTALACAEAAVFLTGGLLVLMVLLFFRFFVRALTPRKTAETVPGIPAPFVWTRLFLASGLALGVLGFWLLGEARNSLNSLDNRTLPGLDVAGEIKQGPPQLYVLVLKLIASGDDAGARARIRRTYDEKYAEQSEFIGRYLASITADEDRRLIETYRTRLRAFDAESRRLLDGTGRATVAGLRSFGENFARFDTASDRLFDFKRQRSVMWVDLAVKNAERAVFVTAFILVILLLVAAGVFARVWGGRLRPLTPGDF